jgi:hypothetical protein
MVTCRLNSFQTIDFDLLQIEITIQKPSKTCYLLETNIPPLNINHWKNDICFLTIRFKALSKYINATIIHLN